MKRKLSYGYPLPSEDTAEIDGFTFTVGDIVLGENADDGIAWDYETPITCAVNLNVDLDRVLKESGLRKADDPWDLSSIELSVALSWASSATKIRGAGAQRTVVDGQNQLEIVLDGPELGGILTVAAVIILAEDVSFNDNRIAPYSAGTILWTSEELQLPLEGGGSRFTTTPVSFKDAGVEPLDAMWLVQISDNLDAPIASGVRVLLNTANRLTQTMLENPNTAEAKLWRQGLETEVITLLIHHAVAAFQQEEFDDTMEVGSLGEGIQGLLNSYFPNETPSDLINELPRIVATARAYIFHGKDA